MEQVDDDERVALRASLGFSQLGPGDTFTELARRGHAPEQPNSTGVPPAFAAPRSAALDRIEEQLTRLQASVTDLTRQIVDLAGPADLGRELEDMARTQRAVMLRLSTAEAAICRVTQEGHDRINERLDALEHESSGKRWPPIGRRRHPAD